MPFWLFVTQLMITGINTMSSVGFILHQSEYLSTEASSEVSGEPQRIKFQLSLISKRKRANVCLLC